MKSFLTTHYNKFNLLIYHRQEASFCCSILFFRRLPLRTLDYCRLS